MRKISLGGLSPRFTSWMLNREAASQLLINNFQIRDANTFDPDQKRTNCPYCHGTIKPDGSTRSPDTEEKLYIHVGKQTYYCQRCASAGPLVKLFKDVVHLSNEDLKRYMENPLSLMGTKSLKEILEEELIDLSRFYDGKQPIKLPDEFQPLDLETNDPEELYIFEYLFNRGLSIEQIIDYGFGFCKTGQYRDRVIIPCYEGGSPIYFVNRLCLDNGKPLTKQREQELMVAGIRKTVNPPMNFNSLGKSEVLYNIDIAKQYDTIIVTEGAFDAINVGQNAVAILGSMISQNQISKLLKTKAKKIIMMLDPDAIDKALLSCKKLEGLIPVYLSVVEAKDPGEATRAQIEEAIADAMQYNSFTLELMSKFRK